VTTFCDFEGFANGSLLSAPYDAVNGTAANATHSSAWKNTGTMGGRFVGASGVTCWVVDNFAAASTYSRRVYFPIPSNPSTSTVIGQLLNGAAHVLSLTHQGTTNQLKFQDSADVQIGSRTTIAAGTRVRAEWIVNGSTATGRLWWDGGAGGARGADSTGTPDLEVIKTANGQSQVTAFALGVTSNPGSAYELDVDDDAFALTAAGVGPASVGTTTVTTGIAIDDVTLADIPLVKQRTTGLPTTTDTVLPSAVTQLSPVLPIGTRPWPDPIARRRWPAPPRLLGGATLWHLTDTHIGDAQGVAWPRMAGVAQDVAQPLVDLNDVAGFVHTGDIVNNSDSDADPEDVDALGWLEQYFVSRPNLWVPGNHDIAWRLGTPQAPASSRLGWELVYGRPGNDVITIGDPAHGNVMRIIGMCPPFYGNDDTDPATPPKGGWTLSAADLAWVEDQLRAAGSTPVWLANHFRLAEQTTGSIDTSVGAQPHGALIDLIASYPNVVGWLCGHMHWDTEDARMVMPATIGGRTIAMVCGPSTRYNTDNHNAGGTLPYRSAYVTYLGDAVAVRYRDHGAARWARGANGRADGGLDRIAWVSLTNGGGVYTDAYRARY
jgi:hypothetical protein